MFRLSVDDGDYNHMGNSPGQRKAKKNHERNASSSMAIENPMVVSDVEDMDKKRMEPLKES